MKDGQPCRRYKEEDIKKRQLKEADKAERERARLGDDKRKEEDLKEELRTLRRKLRETDSKRQGKKNYFYICKKFSLFLGDKEFNRRREEKGENDE